MAEPAHRPLVERRVDAGRITLPAPLRALLGDRVAVAADLAGCVLAARPEVLSDALQGLRRASSRSHHATELYRFLAGTEALVEIDERGRLALPRLHREWAGISPRGNALLLATGSGVQIWDPRRLDILLRVAHRHLRELHSHILREQFELFGDG